MEKQRENRWESRGGGMWWRSAENWVQVPENQTVPGRVGATGGWRFGVRGCGVWTGRSGVVSVGIVGGCESAGVWVFWSEREREIH